MKTTIILKICCFWIFLLAFGLPVRAADEPADKSWLDVTATVDGKYVAKDSSKAEEYGEVPEGFILKRFYADFALKNKDNFLRMWGNNVRLNYADYGMDYGEYGKYKFSTDYRKIPHLFSRSGETIWAETSPGVWRVPDALQQAVQNQNVLDPSDPLFGAAQLQQKAFFSDFLTGAQPVGLGIQRDRGNVAFEYEQNPSLKYNFNYFLENRDGYRPLGTSFGFSWATELPERIDYRTQDVRAGVQYNRNGRSLMVNYDLSLFNNASPVMIWDNPLRIDDRTYSSAYSAGDGTSQGRAQLAPDNKANTINVSAGTKVGNGKVSGSFAFSSWTDSVHLLPFTINTAIPVIPLPSDTFHGKIHNMTANVNYVARLGKTGTLHARYSLYDRNNQKDVFLFHEYVRLDNVLEEFTDEGGAQNHPYAYTSNSVNLDLGWGFADHWNWHAVYDFNRYNRVYRDISNANTNAFTTSLDWLADSTAARISYQYAHRNTGLYEFEGTYAVIPLRRFDEAVLNRNLIRASFTSSPGEKSTIEFNVAYIRDEYPDTIFGLLNYRDFSVGGDYSYAVNADSSVDLFYEFQNVTRDQNGRQSGAAPSTDPLADWNVGLDDKYNTVGAGFSTGFNKKKVVWNTDVSYNRANGNLAISSPPGGVPNLGVPIANADDTDWLYVRTAVTCRLNQRAKLFTFYKFDTYSIDDYAEHSIQTDLTSYGAVTLNGVQPGYEYHTFGLGLTYGW